MLHIKWNGRDSTKSSYFTKNVEYDPFKKEWLGRVTQKQLKDIDLQSILLPNCLFI